MDKPGRTPGRRIALKVQYDGSNFNGYQIQNAGRTVQGEIEKAIFILTKESNRIIASGRTDAGVHALGQIVHFDTDKNISCPSLKIRVLNLPLNHSAKILKPGFGG